MSAIISEKFRIFNAQQFLESLTEGANDQDAARTRMYFFVGRSDPWNSYVEIYNTNNVAFSVGNKSMMLVQVDPQHMVQLHGQEQLLL